MDTEPMQTQERYRSLVENAVEGIFQTTPEGRYLMANPMLARIYGYESPESLMNALTDIAHQLYVDPERRTEFKRLLQEHDAVLGFESQVYRCDGSVIWISECARAVRDDGEGLLGYEGTVVDITARKQAEADLRRAHEELEWRVHERTHELEVTNEALRAQIAERLRAENELQAAHRRLAEAATEKKRFYCDVIRSVTQGKFLLVDASDIPIAGCVALDTPLETMEDYPPLRQQLREVAASVGMDSTDVKDLVLAAGEAITNAIKHGVRGRCTVYKTDDRLLVRVSDQGTGISVENLPASILQAGFTSKVSLGMGYTLMLELADRIWLATEPDGTVVQLEKWTQPREHPVPPLPAAWAHL